MNTRIRQLSRVPPVVILLALFVSACTVVSVYRTADWPKLKVTEHHVSTQEMRDVCTRYTPVLMSPEGCAVIDLNRLTCDIWVDKDFPNAGVLIHEKKHCDGYDHVGSETFKNLVKNWKERS